MVGWSEGIAPRRVLVFCADEHYAAPLAVALRSLAVTQHDTSDLEIMVLSISISPAHRSHLSAAAAPLSLRFEEIDHRITDDLPTSVHYPASVWGRLWAIDHLPPSATRMVYLDADVLVRADLGEVFATEVSSSGVAAVPDVGIPNVAAPLGLPNWRELGLGPATPYCNTGVMVIDPRRWRAARLTERVLTYGAEHRSILSLPDQDSLNAVLRGNFVPLPLRWNQLHHLRRTNHLGYSFFDRDEVDAAIDDPAIVHFSDRQKPWMHGCDDHAADLWWATLQDTPYRGLRPGRPPRRERILLAAGRTARRLARV